MKLLIATFNKGKIGDYKEFCKGLPFEVVNLKDVGIKEDFDEIYDTFEENSKGKAEFYAKRSGLATIADDSGVELPFYDMRPGVKTKRWGGNLTDDEYFAFILDKIKKIPEDKRQAQMRAVLTLCINGNYYQEEGKILGTVTDKVYENSATHGYPWDKVFILDANGKYYEELSKEEDRQFNHRGIAFEKLKHYLL
jgi:XTP/dITP diphosphohydrolase